MISLPPLPLTVVMIPACTRRMRFQSLSKSAPDGSMATPSGPLRETWVAGTLSGLGVYQLPLPATVLMTPAGSTMRTMWFWKSAM